MTSPRDPDETPGWNTGGSAGDPGSGQVPRPWDEPSLQDQPIPPPPAFPPPGTWGGGGNPYGEPPAYGAPAYGAPQPFGAPQPYGAPPPYGVTGGSRRLAPATAGAATAFAFSRFGRAAGVLIAVTVVVGVLSIVLQLGLGAVLGAAGMADPFATPTAVQEFRGGFTYIGNLVLTAVAAFVSAVLSLVMTVGSLRIVRTGSASFTDFFDLPQGWAGYAGGLTLLSTVPALVPSPGASVVLSLLSLVAWIAVLFAACHLVDAPGAPVAAFRASVSTVGAHLGQTLLLLLITFGLTVVGALACLVGLLVAVPVAAVALVALYCGFRQDVVPA
ncbi:hypothetical protein [Serinibacter arcticus]|uniref:Uncharacterized protein n=1 Tax=Serinibacter arcticus TaxID=1655435 RepID=A0A4Z1E115_9MICO|nr:hypothetical protein [Serinibacter arcticus]TGO04372.1 hypothetical protein SERN_1965 [Serinibacter arcticus]